MIKSIAAGLAGAVLGGTAMLSLPSHAAGAHRIPAGYQAVIVTQRTSAFDAPYCVVSQRTRLVYHQVNGDRTKRGQWSAWKVIDEGKPLHTDDGTVCAVQPHS